jgi:hypothetical protein
MQRPYHDGEAWRHDGQRIPSLATAAAGSYQDPHPINPETSHEIASKSHHDTATTMVTNQDHSNIDVATMDRDELQVTKHYYYHETKNSG